MNYYIKGDSANADQINAAFKKLGYDTSGHLFNANSVLYFTLDGEIRATTCNCTPAIIKTHPDYKELPLPVKPKFKAGDWIVSNEGIFKITQYEDEHGYNLTDTTRGVVHFVQPDYVESNFHLWAIEDAKDGDVLATDNGWTCIFKAFDGRVFSSYCFMDSQKWFCEFGSEAHTLDSRINGNIHPATKEQRDLLFKKMKEAGYEWDAEKKELHKIKPHYNIANFHAGMPVLVRDDRCEKWCYALYSHYDSEENYPFITAGDNPFIQCIPFEGNEHLLGTTDMPDEMYINW